MPGPAPCSRAPPPPREGPNRRGWPDLLRLERFGGLYYKRRDGGWHGMTPVQARLLVAAGERNLLEHWAADPAYAGIDEPGILALALRWRQEGLLDAEHRNPAELIDVPRDHDALVGPMVTHLQLTQQCNMRCRHCYVDVMAEPSPAELSTERVAELFGELRALGAPVVVLAGGEPLLRPDLFEILAAAEAQQIDLHLCSNGLLIDEGTAARLASSAVRSFSISIDGPDAATHEQLRRGGFDQAKAGVERLVAAGAAEVQLRVTVTRANLDRLSELAPLGQALGVQRVAFRPYRHSGVSEADALGVDFRTYREASSRLRDAWPFDAIDADIADGMPVRPPAWTGIIPPFGCVGGNTSVTITFDGRVVGCGAVTRPGDWTLHERSFADCWAAAPGVLAWRELAGNETCQGCEQLARCGGGCRARAIGSGGGIDDPDPWAPCAGSDRSA